MNIHQLDEIQKDQKKILEMLKRGETNAFNQWKQSFGLAAILASLVINPLNHWVAVVVFILGFLIVVLSRRTLKKLDALVSKYF
jgi:Flp pilus assembly protein TadB